MKAAVCREFGHPLTIEEVALRAPGPGEVEVKLGAVAICHSDISYAEGAWGGPLPAVFGHEAAGTVVAAGAGVGGLAAGDRVLVWMVRSCGHCLSCAGGHPTMCDTRLSMDPPLSAADGGPMHQGLETGAFAERVVVDASQVVKLPVDIPFDAACLLACGVITGVGAAINTAKVKPGSTVVVIGAGGVGLNAIQGAALAGAARIIAIDMSEDKLAAAREFGATDGILANSDKPHRQVKALNDGRGADYVLVTVGSAKVYQGASAYLAKGGMLVMVGMPPSGEGITVEPVVVAASSQSIAGSFMGDTLPVRDIPHLVTLWRQGRLKLDELISNRYRLEEINEAIAGAKSGTVRRNVIVFE
jgi:S-(hydroxymethyl)glutathione dehydrogenase/alcohol dehydrogenase